MRRTTPKCRWQLYFHRRAYSLGDPLSTATELNRYSGVLGAWYRKGSLHTDVSAEYGAADNWVYRTDPLNFFNFRGNVSYAPRPWLMLGGYFTYQKASNNTPGIN